MRVAALALLIAAGGPPALAQDAVPRLDGATAVTLVPATPETGGRMQTVSRDYHRAYYYAGDSDQRYLLVEVETTQLHDLHPAEDYPPTPHRVISIRDASAGGFGPIKARWEIDADAVTVADFAEDPVIVENYGCCDSARTLRSLDLLTGRMLSVRSDNVPVPALRLFGQDTVEWTAEVITTGAELDIEILPEDGKTVAMVTLLGDGRPVQRLTVQSVATGRTVDDMPALEHVLGWALKPGGEAKPIVEVETGKKASPALVWILADYPMEKPSRIEIPLVSGRLDLAHAKLPRGVTLADKPLD